MKSISTHAFFFLLFVLIIGLPLKHQIDISPPGTFYPKIQGIFQDYYLDISIIKQGRIQWEEIDQYTTEKTALSKVHLYYLALGRIGKWIHIGDIEMYYLGIFTSLILFYVFTYKLISLVVSDKYRTLALYLVFFGGPFPAMTIPFFGNKLAVGTQWWTYMDIYNRLMLRPHHFLAGALLVGSVYYFLLFYRKIKIKFVLLSALLCATAVFISGIAGIIFILASGLSVFILFLRGFLIRKSQNIRIFCLGLFIIISFSVYPLYFLKKELASGFPNSTISVWGYQTFRAEVFPYLFSVYVLSLGLLLPLGLLSFWSIFKKYQFERIFIALAAFFPYMLYLLSVNGVLHVNKLRFVYSAPYVFWGILAVWGIELILSRFQGKKYMNLFSRGLFFLLIINTLFSLKDYWWEKLYKKEIFLNTYIPDEYMEAVDYLDKNTSHYSSVLSTFYVGSYLPALTYNKVYIGNETSTYNFSQKWWFAEQFFKKALPAGEVKQLLSQNDINYVFWDQGDLLPDYAQFMVKIYQNELVSLYKVKDNPK